MIIRIIGTNGSGKSTVVRLVTSHLLHAYEIKYDPKRRKPEGNVYERSDGRQVFVPGHYLIQNGGVDTMKNDLAYIYKIILEHHGWGQDIIYEGKNHADGASRALRLHQAGIDYRLVLLTTPLDECVKRVRKRGHHIKEEDIRKRYDGSIKIAERLEEAGARVIRTPIEPAASEILNWLAV